MARKPSGITLAVVLEHMRHSHGVLRNEIRTVARRLEGMEKRMSRLDSGMGILLDQNRWMESHDLPRRVSELEDTVFAGIDPKRG